MLVSQVSRLPLLWKRFCELLQVLLPIYRLLTWLFCVMFAYLFVIFAVFLLGYGGILLVAIIGMIHFINSKRSRILDMYPRCSVAFILNILFLAHIGIILTFLGMPLYFGAIISPYTAGVIVVIAVVLWRKSTLKTGTWFPPPMKIMAFISIAAYMMLIFETGNRSWAEDRILKQKSIRPVLVDPKTQKKLGLPEFIIYTNDMQRFMSDSEDGFIYVSMSYFGGRKSGVIQIDLNDLRKIRWLKLPGCHNFAMNAAEDTIYVSGTQQCEVYVVHIPELKLERTIPIKKKCWPSIEDILLYEKEGFLLVNEEGNNIYKVDIKSGKIEGKIRTPFMTMVDVMKKNPISGRTYASGDAIFSVFGELDRNLEKYTDKKIFYWGMDFAFSQDGRRAYLNNSWTGYLYDLDLKTFKIIRKIRIAPGLRDVVYDDERGLIYIGNYATGEVFAIDEKTGNKVAIWNFGKRVRDILLTKKNHRMFVLSAYGIFEVDIDGVLKKKYSSEGIGAWLERAKEKRLDFPN